MQTAKIVPYIFFLLFLSCKQEVTKADLANLSGYWEISYVIREDGTRKDYKVNETIDHFTVKGTAGFRRKMMPALDGSYFTSGDSEKFEVSFTNMQAVIHYQTPFSKRTEQLKSLSAEELVVENNHITYHYKRPIPFTKK